MPDDHDDATATRADGGTGRIHVPITSIDTSAPQFQIAAKHPRRVERLVAAAFLIGTLGFVGFGIAYWQLASNFWLGLTLTVGLGGVGYGMVIWGTYLMPRGPFSEDRHRLVATPAERAEFVGDFASRGKVAVERRGFLAKLLGLASAALGVVVAFPLIRSLAPLPGKSLYETAWRKGSRLVDFTGRPVLATDVEVGGYMTVFPEDDVGGAYSQTMLVRPGPAGSFVPPNPKPGREHWGPDGYLAFSKVCTHAGCPVGLYQKLTKNMLCPCHQSVFDCMNAADPVFGPAPRPLPQLPLYVDSHGYLRASKGYNEPVGPGFWERGND
jgi:ubiquinol-cytochrome c reductase iron-sulfur subunit